MDVAQDVIVRQEDCDIEEVDLIGLRVQLSEDPLDALELLHDSLLGKELKKPVIIEGKEILAANEQLTERSLETLAQNLKEAGLKLECKNMLKGTEQIDIGLEPQERRQKREQFIASYEGKTEAVSGHKLTAEHLEEILLSEQTTLYIRQNNIRGIEVGGLGLIESLKERILGRTLAEDVYDKEGKILGRQNEIIDESKAELISKHKDRVLIRSVLTCKARQGVCQACLTAGPAASRRAWRATPPQRLSLFCSSLLITPTPRRVSRTRESLII